MTACFGDGILGFIPGGIEGTEAKVDFLKEFAALGLSHKFREIVDGRVIELAYKKGGVVSVRWLPDEEAAPIFEAEKSLGAWAPHRLFPICLRAKVYIPGCRTGSHGTITMPDKSLDGWPFAPMRDGIAALEEWVGYLEKGELEGDLEFTTSLLQQMKLASEHRLLYTIGD